MPAGFTPSPSFKSLWFRRLLWKMLPSRIFHGLYLGAGLPRYGRTARSIWGADLLYLATKGWKVLWKLCEGSIFHRNFPEINGLEGGEGVKDVLGSFSCYWLWSLLFFKQASSKSELRWSKLELRCSNAGSRYSNAGSRYSNAGLRYSVSIPDLGRLQATNISSYCLWCLSANADGVSPNTFLKELVK